MKGLKCPQLIIKYAKKGAQKEFCEGYNEGWDKGQEDVDERKYDLDRSPIFNEVKDLLMTCLKIVAKSYPTPIPFKELAELDAALTALEAYKTMDDGLEEGKRLAGKEDPEEGTLPCAGTYMLLIFCFLAVCIRILSEEKE